MAEIADNTGRVIFLDIETSPNLGYSWGPKWEQDILEYVKEWYLLGFAYQVLGESRVRSHMLIDYPGFKGNPFRENDRALVQELWNVIDSADVIVAHNGDQFDIPMANVRFVHHKMKPPAPFRTIDTKKMAKSGTFRFNSNKLDDLARYFGIGRKVKHTGKDLWFDCMKGDLEAWRLMRKYNIHDVRLLKGVYERMRPYAKSHPNFNLFTDLDGCPRCPDGGRLQRRGFVYASGGLSKRHRHQCMRCGAWALGKVEKTHVTIR
jgi:hypothetical protein